MSHGQAIGEAWLALARSRIHDLEADGVGSREEKSRVDRHVEALRKAHASARTAAHDAHWRVDDSFAELATRLRIAEHSRAAEVAGSRGAFVRAVEAELSAWDDYLARLQKRAARTEAGTDVSTGELRSSRNEVASRLDDVRTAPDGAWRERRDRVFDALDELDHSAGMV